MRAALLLSILLSGGCAYRVALTSSPGAAEVVLPDETTVRTPTEIRLRWVPFGRQRIQVSAPGYRSVTLDLRRREIRGSRYLRDAIFRPRTFFGTPRGQVNIVLVPSHGPTGTWREEEVP